MKATIKMSVDLSVCNRFSNFRSLVLFLVVAIFANWGTICTYAAVTNVLGEQDYADGDVIGSNSTWNDAQAGEPYPFDTIHVAPKTITFTHTGLDTGRQGILTFSLWDLDAEFAGNQVSAFSLDGIPQDISAFELPATDLKVRIFSFSIDPGFLSDGELVVSLTFEGPPLGNEVGIDFSRVDILPAPVSAPDIQRWSVSNGFYALNFFGDGTLLAAASGVIPHPNTPGYSAVPAAKLDPRTGTTIAPFYATDVRTSIRLGPTPGQNWIVGGYQDRSAWDQDGNFLRLLRDLGCCNIPRFPLALDHTRDVAYVQSSGQLFGLNMSTGATQYFFYGAGDNFGMISIADPDTLYTSGRNGNVTRLHPLNGRDWLTNIDTNDMQPGAVTADGSFVVTTGSAHFAGMTSPGRLARILPNGVAVWNNMVNAVTPPVIGSNGLIFVGTQPAPIDENGPGAIEAYDPNTGNRAWSTPVHGLPNDLLVGDDGAVYAGTGSYGNGKVYSLGQNDGVVRKIVADVPGAWEIVLRAGLLYASGFNQYNSVDSTITSLPVEAVNYDPNSPWPVRYHDNQRTSNRNAPILNPPRDVDPDQEFPITIDPQAYTGRYYIADNINPLTGPFTGLRTFNLKAGNYAFDNGNAVGTSLFNFTVDNSGQITNISNPAAATANGSTLLLNNTVINVNPQAYGGRYNFLSFNTHYTGARSFTVIPGLRYGIDNGTSRGGASAQSYFYFEVGASGTISNVDVPLAAYGDANTLYFYNTTLIVQPNGYAGNYNLSSYYQTAPYVSGQRSFVLIPGLLYAFDAGTGSYEPTFKLDANGTPTNIDPAGFASGVNNSLVLANVLVHIDPTNYSGNYRLNDRIFSGIQDQVLIPNVRFYVSVNNSVGYFFPGQTAVTPPSVTLIDGGNTYVFNFSIGGLLPGLVGWWRGEGNALDSVGTNHGTLQSGTTYATGKIGQGFDFHNFFNDWVRINSQVFNPSGGSISTWFKWDGNEPANWFSASVLFGSYDGAGTTAPTAYIYFGTLFWSYNGATGATGLPISPNNWYHFSMTYDSDSTVKVFLNGVLIDKRQVAQPAGFRNEFGIGRGAGYSAVGFTGVIDEMQVYDRPLNDCEVRNIYNSGNGISGDTCDDPLPQPDPSGLISWWKGEDNALDSISENHGTLRFGATYGDGISGRAFLLSDYTRDEMKVISQVYDMSGGSTSVWFNWDGNHEPNWVFSEVLIGSYQGGITSSPTMYIYFDQIGWQFANVQRNTQITITPGQWYHAVITYDSNYNAKFYLNGSLIQQVQADDPLDFRDEVGIGRGAGITSGSFTGILDEVQIFNRPLSDCEVVNLYNSPGTLPADGCDNGPPSTTAALNPVPNPAGWNNSNIGITLTAVDNTGGSGVNEIIYGASGAQSIPTTTVSGTSANLTITAEGETTITYYARDNSGNTEAAQTVVVRIDKTAPLLTSSATAGGNPYSAGTWTNQNVVVSFDCTDSGSGVGDVTQPVTLSSEGANQSATATCSDVAGNSAESTLTDVDIDKTAPAITVNSPTSGNYLLNQVVTVDFQCTDSLSGVSSCIGTTANGGALDTASIDAKTFSVDSSDAAGNNAPTSTVNYTVAFGIEALFDQTKANKSGSTVPIKIQLVDANGVNVSSSAIVVHAVSVVQIGSQASPILEDPGNSNPDLDFRYQGGTVGGQYHFNLKTTGYGTGTYRLNFIAGNSPTVYFVQFQVRR